MTEREAQEFHGIFFTSFLVFTAVAVLAHILVWIWRPWLQTPDTAQASLDMAHLFSHAQLRRQFHVESLAAF